MVKKIILLLVACSFLIATNSFAAEHRIGGGANYWVALEDVETDEEKFDEDGLSFLASYQYLPGILALELDLEFLPDRFGESAIAPQAYLLLGRSVYAGIGVGLLYRDGEFSEEPFFALRAGLNLELLPGLYADIYGNYRFNDKTELDNEETDVDTDTVFLGAAIRVTL